MSTKSEQFASKIRYLHEYHSRVMHNIYPVPTGTDIANTLKYFSQILLSILLHAGRRDPPDSSTVTVPVPLCMLPIPFPTTPSSLPLVRPGRSPVTRSLLCSVLRDVAFDCAQPSCDSRLAEYPSFDYPGLYAALVYLIDLVPVLQHGPYDLGQSIFYTMACLAPFLHDDVLGTLPYTMVSTLATFPSFLHKDILDFLASTFLPMAIFGSSKRESVTAYVNLSAASMLMIVMQYTSNPVYHCQLLECLMKYKQEVWKDLLYVIAYGPAQVKSPAVQMLFHYWPNLKPPGAISEYRGLQYTAWNPIHCQHTECQNPINKPAVKMCLDPSFAVTGGDKPPPLYLCVDCIHKIPRDQASWLFDVLFPQGKQNCSSDVKRAVVTCFTEACCRNFGNRPVRYCRRCHHSHHNGIPQAEAHLYQTSIPPINTRECGAEELVCTMEVIVSLLKEVEYHAEQREYALNHRRKAARAASNLSPEHAEPESSDDVMQDQRLLSQFAIWLLLSLCTPNENTPTETLARLVSMVFQWFHSTAYMLDDDVGSIVEKLKPQFVTKWLKSVCDARFDVMVMCLLPKPMEFARVGGYWERSCSTVSQLKEGLNRILSLIPYNVISLAVWECIMPEWLEALRTDVPENHIKEFREVLSKMFDIELCPLPFSMEEMFGFISCRFTGCAAVTQEQALLWLHVLSELDIVVPLILLINMFLDGVNSVQEFAGKRKCNNDPHGSHSPRKQHTPVMETTHRAMLSPHGPFHSPHRQSPQGSMDMDPGGEDEELNLSCYILMLDLILKQVSLSIMAPWDGIHSSALFYELAHDLLAQLVPNEESYLRYITNLKNKKQLCHLMPFCFSAQTSGKETEIQEKDDSTESKFCLEQLTGPLKLIYTILQEMKKFEDPDIVFNMVNCLRALCLRGGVLSSSKYQQTAFLPYILENMLIPSLWEALRSDYSQLPSVATALLQHALTLPQGADIFWATIDNTFNSKEWKVRFEAVEKVVVLCRFLDVTATAKSHTLKYSLSHALCCYLAAIEDPSPAVSTRARLLLDTIKHSSLRVLCTCLDFQFDMVVKDRPTILNKLLILHSLRPDIQALSWEFFVNRFDTLSLEAQLHLDCNKEFPFPTTITTVRTNVIHLSDAAVWKIKRARFARNRQKSVRSLRDSVKRNSNSKRTSSLPDSTSSKLRMQTSGEADTAGKEAPPEDGRIDQQTVYLLISTLMRFMIKENAGGDGELSSVKAFSTVKRHLHVLLGFDQQEGCFMVAPNKLRTSTCFHAFITGISQVLDYNIFLGKQFLSMILQVLKYSACPQLRHYFQQPPRCSLWSLRPHIRQLWLKVLLVILYKYPYMEGDTCKLVMHLIHITMNTLDAQYHSCKPHPTAGPVCSDNSFTSKYSEKEKNGKLFTNTPCFIATFQHLTKKQTFDIEAICYYANLFPFPGTKCNLASVPSIPSMFVPVPEEFAEQSSMAADRCHDCGAVLEEYDEETLSLAIVVLSTFVHLSSGIAAPILLDLLQSVGRYNISVTTFTIVIPGNAPGVAKQFLRCIFHQLAPNGILLQLFRSYIKDVNFLRTLANVLSDFSELSSIAALNILLEGLNGKRNLPTGAVMLRCLDNLATFMEALPMESPSNLWASICSQLQAFLPKLPLSLSVKCCLDSCLRIIISILKIPATIATRSLLDHFSKLLSFVIQNSNFSLAYVMDICALCHKNFSKERDKLYLTRSVVLELLQALKFKSTLPDTNLQQLVQCQTAAMEVTRQYLTDLLDFIADLHTLTKLKAHMKTCTQSLHEDTLGGHLKVGLSQVVGMELTRGNNRDSKAVARHLPWLFHPPSVMQQGPKEFVECVLHIRLLSWLLLGALTHSTLSPSQTSGLLCTPLPLDAGPYMADHLLVVIMGFSEHSKASMAHIASLFHAFIFAQLWTVYCEQQAGPAAPWTPGDVGSAAALSAMEFWSRVTPGILQLIAPNQVVWYPRNTDRFLNHSLIIINDAFDLLFKFLLVNGIDPFS
uniref:Unc-79 homolog, NALCN channel complex subunit n=1 Tax=Eptatretus burgeri TaxID=7764 RepID=A0A8C4PWE9_EPTBU